MGQPLVFVWAAHPAVTSTKQSAKYNWFFDNKCGCFSSSSSCNTLKRPACIHVACHRLPSCSSTRATSSQTWRLSSGNCTTCSPPRRMTNWKPSETNTPTSKSRTTKISLSRRVGSCGWRRFWVLTDSMPLSGFSLRLPLCRQSAGTLWRKPYRRELQI